MLSHSGRGGAGTGPVRRFKIGRRALDALGADGRSERGTRYSDSELPGFLLIAYTRRLVFACRYRVAGLRRTITLGAYPVVSPEDARKAALAVLGDAARGEDEAEKRAAVRHGVQEKAERITFGEWRSTYLKDAARRLKGLRNVRRYLAMPAAAWDGRALADITTADVKAFRDGLLEGKHRAGANGETQANRWTRVLSACFASAALLDHIERNPVKRVQLLAENPSRQRVLSEDEEKRLRETLSSWKDPFAKVAILLMLDAGARLSETLHARWTDFTLDPKTHEGTWRIPSPKSGRQQAVPVIASVGAAVAATPRLDDNPFLLPGRKQRAHRVDLKTGWAALKAAAKLPDDVWVHDLRRTFGLRVVLAEGMFAASRLLRHANYGVTDRVYAPLVAEHLRGFAERVEAARQGKLKP
jgi:integrase